MGEVHASHATRWLADTGSLRFLIDGERIGEPHTAHRQRLSGLLPAFTKQPQRPPQLPEPPPRRANSSSDCHSYGGGNGGRFSKWSSCWSDKNSHYSGISRSDGSWEDDSLYDSCTHSYGSWDSNYDGISIKQSVREYRNYDLHTSDEDRDNSEAGPWGRGIAI